MYNLFHKKPVVLFTIAYIGMVTIILSFAAFPSTVPFLAGTLLQIAIIAPSVVLSFLGGIIGYQKFMYQVRKRKSSEYIDSLISGGIKEKLPTRPLEIYEKDHLVSLYERTHDKKYDLDSRSPIFTIRGNLINSRDNTLSVPETWSVRGLQISEENYPQIKERYFKTGQELLVEFSPYSQLIWDIYKTYKNKKVWLMSLTDETYHLLNSGKITSIVRVPLGTHDLRYLRYGDYVEFCNSKISILGHGPKILSKIESTKRYTSIKDLIEAEGLQNIFPNETSIESAISSFLSKGTFKERINKGGVYAIHLTKLNTNTQSPASLGLK